MTGNLYQAFGHELVNQRRTQFELEARRYGLSRSLKRARKVDQAAAKSAPKARGAAPACCAADLG